MTSRCKTDTAKSIGIVIIGRCRFNVPAVSSSVSHFGSTKQTGTAGETAGNTVVCAPSSRQSAVISSSRCRHRRQWLDGRHPEYVDRNRPVRNMMPSLGTPCAAVVTLGVGLLFAAGPCRSSVFDGCERAAAGNVTTAAECVGKLLLDTLTKVSEDPKGFFEANVSTAPGPTTPALGSPKSPVGFDRDKQILPRPRDCRINFRSTRISNVSDINYFYV